MLAKRIVVALDVKDRRVVKGVRFENIRDAGDPVEMAARYENEGALSDTCQFLKFDTIFVDGFTDYCTGKTVFLQFP